ncbi:MAG: hypothetical protein J6D87_09725 [Clostridia bacterium]|nr:hypothetical protein [Clostridia bacterium]
MKRTLSILIALLLCLSVFAGCEKINADTALPPFDPPTSEGVTSVSVSSLPEGYNYSFTGETAKKVVDYFSEVQLTSKYDDNPNEMTGMTLVVSITYQDGRTETLYEFSPFIRKDGGSWYKIVQNDATHFHTLLNELNNEYNEIPNDPQSATSITSHGYVLYVSEDGFVAHINAYGNVFVKNKGSDAIDVFDTVIIEYYEANLFRESGSFDIAGEIEQYSYMLEAISVRVADPSKGDPVFG